MISLKDYPSLQCAVDAAGKFDVIVVPPGDWRCGAARLKNDLTLRLEKGARLIAPERLEEYLPAERLIRNRRSLTHFFLGLIELENVTIEGEGVLELNGHRFWQNYDGLPPRPEWLERGDDGFFKSKLYTPSSYRPVGIWMENCRNIRLCGITLRNSAAYTVWPVGCEHLEIDRLTIDNDRRGPNTDGLDIDGCRDVLVSNCRISSGDDCIAVKSDRELLGSDRPCERIRICGNILSSHCCGVRLGFEGDNPIRDVLASDNIIVDSNVGYDLLSVIPAGHHLGIERGTPIENVVMTGCVMRNVRQPLKIWSGAVSPDDASRYAGYVHRVHFSDMEIEATDSSFLGGADVSDISLANVNIHVVRDPLVYRNAKPVEMPTLWGRGYMPEALTVRNVRNFNTTDVRITEE